MNNYTIGVFNDSADLYKALYELEDSDFPLEQISIIVKNTAEELELNPKLTQTKQNYSNYAGEGTRSGAVSGSVVGSILGLLVGTGLIAIPFVGPIMLSEAAFTVIATAVAGSGIGVASGGILGHIVGFGISRQSLMNIPNSDSQGDYQLIIEGDERNIQDVNAILAFQSQYWTNYQTMIDDRILELDETERSLAFQHN